MINLSFKYPLLRIGVLMLVTAFSLPVISQDATPLGGITGGKSFVVANLPDTEIRVDGRLDEDIWSRAAVITDFHQMAPFEYTQPSQPTEVRVFYSSDAIYIGAHECTILMPAPLT